MPTINRLSEADRARVRHHLGYSSTEPVSSIALGFPATQYPLFLVERAMDRVMPEAVGLILKSLSACDAIEQQQIDALRRLKAQQLGELKLRNSNEEATEQDLLEMEHKRWAGKLADDLGVPFNPFSIRNRETGMQATIPVVTWG